MISIGTIIAMTAMATRFNVDMHLNTSSQLSRHLIGLDSEEGLHGGFHELDEGGTNIAVEYVWAPASGDPRARVYGLIDQLHDEASRIEGLRLVRSPASAKLAIDSGEMAMVLAVEGAHALGEDAWSTTLQALHREGVSILGLAWSFSNIFAGSSGDSGGGLTELGEELLAQAWRQGILIDLSGATKAATMAVCEQSPVPVIASYSNASALMAHHRNLTDEEIRCIADTGGVIGVNLHRGFLGGDEDLFQVIAHIEHITEVAGRDAVGLGSGYDGFIHPAYGLESAADYTELWRQLRKRGWREAQIDMVRGDNFFRAWSEVVAWPHRVE